MMTRAWQIDERWTTRRMHNFKKSLLRGCPRCCRLLEVHLPSGSYLRMADLAEVIIRAIRRSPCSEYPAEEAELLLGDASRQSCGARSRWPARRLDLW